MKTTTCQLVQGGVITGYVHYIGRLDPLWPLCEQTQIRLCQATVVEFLPTSTSANCPHCAKIEDRIPLVYSHSPLMVGIR